jgi:uncharacterized protein (TIGR00661 family)
MSFVYFVDDLKTQERILVCPLDWGLGHASRCVPIIRYLLEQKHELVLAASGSPLALLREEFPSLPFIEFEGYNIHYSKRFLWLTLLYQVPKIFLGIFREHVQLKKNCLTHNISLVISDNRFGCWNSSIKSIFISHQLFIRAPFFQKSIRFLNFWVMQKYDHIWIPDLENENNYSGALSHGKNIPAHARYVGLLSRFSLSKNLTEIKKNYSICVMLSGPEPQRNLLEEILIEQIEALKISAKIVRGLPTEVTQKVNTTNIEYANHLPTEELQELLECSEIVVCRAGYSSIMDLAALGKKAILIPTPDQTEQEYLAAYLMEKNICFSMTQNDFDLKTALAKSVDFKGFGAIQAELNFTSLGI